MTISVGILIERCDKIKGYMDSCRQLVIANSESGGDRWSGVLVLIDEADIGLSALKSDLTAMANVNPQL